MKSMLYKEGKIYFVGKNDFVCRRERFVFIINNAHGEMIRLKNWPFTLKATVQIKP